ncbi:transcriptional regulator [Legionella busanensis]|uniref:Transcriptional regulator n=1 Tax=Legionella busanensis TaxID=190655 RepID=A0A378JLD0_9GAMM|nr:transglycosylase SLT domain-containing protein [Legionella busanensis]STX51541.1 transcriptional regulator [Legionella busanensis]
MNFLRPLLLSLLFLLSACATKPPRNVDNLCYIFKQYPGWYRDAREVAHRWQVPVSVQMAIIHQESKFDGRARPKRTRILWVIPWKRPSSAYGYTQALRTTWALYKKNNGRVWSSRSDFTDAVDFIGWYINQINLRTGIPRNDAYNLYLAYHEGIGGYQRQTFLKRPWVMQVARKVSTRADIYHAQLSRCH